MARINKQKLTITFSNIWNESQTEQVTLPADKTGCTYETKEYGTKIIVKATDSAQLQRYINEYNK